MPLMKHKMKSLFWRASIVLSDLFWIEQMRHDLYEAEGGKKIAEEAVRPALSGYRAVARDDTVVSLHWSTQTNQP